MVKIDVHEINLGTSRDHLGVIGHALECFLDWVIFVDHEKITIFDEKSMFMRWTHDHPRSSRSIMHISFSLFLSLSPLSSDLQKFLP